MPHEIRLRASAIGKLMAEPRSKSEGPLSAGAKTYIRELVAQDVFGVDFEVSSKYFDKGIQTEPACIALVNRVLGKSLTKNTERRTDEFITGEPDLIDDAEIIDTKSAWSLATFPLSEEDVNSTQRTLYEWQLRAYCRLFDKPRGRIAYCMVDTPEALIYSEPLPLHVVQDIIPEHLRLTMWTVERDAAKEAAMVEKVKHARAYYAQVIAEFDRSHQPLTEGAAA